MKGLQLYKRRLPVKRPDQSLSREIQAQHVRKYDDHLTLVNKGVAARINTSVVRPTVEARPLKANIKPRSSPIKLRPRPTKDSWKVALKPDTGITGLDKVAALKKDMDLKGIKLYSGEKVAGAVVDFHHKFMGTMGEVFFRDPVTGERIMVMMETRMSNADTIEYLLDKIQTGGRIIYKIKDSVPVLEYVRPYEAEPEAPIFPMEETMVHMGPVKIGDPNSPWVVIKEYRDGRKKKVRVKNFEDFQKRERAANKKGRDIFGDRLSSQTQIKEFKGDK
jgi:hypothetical protein